MNIEQSPAGEDGKRQREIDVGYTVLGQTGNVLHTVMDHETRRDETGRFVKWDMVVLDPDHFCWHRTDWKEGGCTATIQRCKPR